MPVHLEAEGLPLKGKADATLFTESKSTYNSGGICSERRASNKTHYHCDDIDPDLQLTAITR